MCILRLNCVNCWRSQFGAYENCDYWTNKDLIKSIDFLAQKALALSFEDIANSLSDLNLLFGGDK